MKKRLLAGLLAALLLPLCASCSYDKEAASYQLPSDTLELAVMYDGWDIPDGMFWLLGESDTQRFADLVNLIIPRLDVSLFPYEGDTLYTVDFSSYKDPVDGGRHGYVLRINENYVKIGNHCYHTDDLLLEIVELYFSYSEVVEW